MIVIDASVAAKWYLEEDGSAAALHIARGAIPIVAPDLLIVEVANVMWRKAKIGQVTEQQLRTLVSHLPGALNRLVPTSELLEPALDLARLYDHPVYDCCYLALAVRTEAELITADERFLRRFRETPHAGRIVPLSPRPTAARSR